MVSTTWLFAGIPNAALYTVSVDHSRARPIYDIGETWLVGTMVAKVNYWIQVRINDDTKVLQGMRNIHRVVYAKL